MNLRNQVCTFEQSERLKELGVAQNESYLQWGKYKDLPALLFDCDGRYIGEAKVPEPLRTSDYIDSYTAFTVAELWIMLPNEIEPDHFFSIERTEDEGESSTWSGCYRNWFTRYNLYGAMLKNTQAEACAAVLIILLECGKVTADQINLRLQS